MCRMYVPHNHQSVFETSGMSVHVVLDYRLIIGGSMSQSFNHSTYMVVNVQGGFWAQLIKILVFPRPIRNMLTSFDFSLLN